MSIKIIGSGNGKNWLEEAERVSQERNKEVEEEERQKALEEKLGKKTAAKARPKKAEATLEEKVEEKTDRKLPVGKFVAAAYGRYSATVLGYVAEKISGNGSRYNLDFIKEFERHVLGYPQGASLEKRMDWIDEYVNNDFKPSIPDWLTEAQKKYCRKLCEKYKIKP